MGEMIFYSALVVYVYMTLWYVIAMLRSRNDVADIAWGVGFFTLTLALFLQLESVPAKAYVLIAMVGVWAFRLALHIAARHENKAEDARYVAMRKKWRYKRLQSYTNVFLSQGVLMLLVAAPIMVYFNDPNNSFTILSLAGLLIWVTGMFFEVVGDYQLKRFIDNPKNKGKIMRYGLWSLTRHPNYFGEISLWWGFWLFSGISDNWIYGLLGPITITTLILGISGIPMLEKKYKGNKEYEKYQKTTSAFFPIPPKN
jgi:steroid 5-alpha reductase family enzyme